MKIYIAPMAGVTDYSFRQILKEYNPDFMYCEMVSSNLFTKENEKTLNSIMKMSSDEKTGIQLFGSDMNDLFCNFLRLKEMGFDNLLLNMGCPQPKIMKSKAGAYLVNNLDEIRKLVEKLNKYDCKISFKVRLSDNIQEIVDITNEYELPNLFVHFRTLEQKFDYQPNYSLLNKIANNRRFNLFVNGGIFTLEDYTKIKDYDIDGVMLARGVIKRPYLIQEIRENSIINYSLDDMKKILIRQLEFMKEDKGQIKACMEINKFVESYFKEYNIDLKEIMEELNYDKKIEKIKKAGVY